MLKVILFMDYQLLATLIIMAACLPDKCNNDLEKSVWPSMTFQSKIVLKIPNRLTGNLDVLNIREFFLQSESPFFELC